ncbi:MAG: hypothetical protein AVDCRST_MAG56-4783 [uncultured Cytophagales bacterium]|uniref:Type II toxin-antitoxin system PemK/MazF family toxin n=1 Tax=uncultured Cytophagales bacterium TaxID=158755 RepID=A0A6J4K1E8_9SPHI|nr:MAG: hypothetical protein AVDCRST_MAG56-4783 [uncultured Cytophagales bacterium]
MPKFHQRQIVNAHYAVGRGEFEWHPALIVSADNVFDAEGFYYLVMMSTKDHNPEFIFELAEHMITRPAGWRKQAQITPSYIKCQLMDIFWPDQIGDKIFGTVKPAYFREIITTLNRAVFGIAF